MAVLASYIIRFASIVSAFAFHGIMCDLPLADYQPKQQFIALKPEPCNKYLPTDLPLVDIARELKTKNNKLDYCTCRMILRSNKTSQTDEFRGFWFNTTDPSQPWFFAEFESSNDLVVVSSIDTLLSFNPHKRTGLFLIVLPVDWFEFFLTKFVTWLKEETLFFSYVLFFAAMVFFLFLDLVKFVYLVLLILSDKVASIPGFVVWFICVGFEPFDIFLTKLIHCNDSEIALWRECSRQIDLNYQYC